jgi:diguanylate cyclase (GGDEF)-like protein/PAS domain S-box-containing protein
VLLGGVIVAVVVVVTTIVVYSATTTQRHAAAQVAHLDEVQVSSFLIERRAVDIETGVRAFAATGDRTFLQPATEARTALAAELIRLRQLVANDQVLETQVDELQDAIDSYNVRYALPLSVRETSGRAALIAAFARGKRLFDGLRARFDQFNASVTAMRASSDRAAASTETTLWTVRLITTGGILLALVGLMLYVLRGVLLPVRRVVQACARVAAGERGELLTVSGSTELSDVAVAFNSMVERLAADERSLRESEAQVRSMEERFRTAFDEGPIGMALVAPDGRFLRVNHALCAIVGYSEAELLGVSFQDITHPDDLDGDLEFLRQMLNGEIRSYQMEKRYLHKDGSSIGVNLSVSLVRDRDGKPVHFVSHIEDITERKQIESALEVAQERFRSAFDHAPIGMALLDLKGRFSEVNDSLCDMLGYSREQLEGMRLESITHPDEFAADQEAFEDMRAGSRTAYGTERRYLHASGHILHCALNATTLTDPDGHARAFLSQIQDITDRRRQEEQLEYLAGHDSLTGLLNRRSFAQALEAHTGMVERYGPIGTVLMIDVDRFKFVNDTLGHQAGDELIVRIAQLLVDRLRDSDVIARLGGDEFAVLLPRADSEAAETVARSVLETLRSARLPIAGSERRITASIGVASFEDMTGLSAEDVLINADLAMYDAKEEGRDRIAIFSSDQYTQARMKGRITWAQRITAALDADRFTLLAQPIMDLSTGCVNQYELLLRMHDEHGDLIPPSAFLYIAERLDLIQQIDSWVVAHGIQMLSELDPRHDISLEINLSARSVGDEKLLALIDSELRNARVAPERVIFEITETAALNSVTNARAFGDHLSEIGCRFALDDFGAGFGSFYYLKHLTFDYLKIDGEFVRDCRSNPIDKLVIAAIVQIASGMGKQTIAEFVGDNETVRLLTRLGVDYGQGYHLGVPAPLDEQLAARAEVPALAVRSAATA